MTNARWNAHRPINSLFSFLCFCFFVSLSFVLLFFLFLFLILIMIYYSFYFIFVNNTEYIYECNEYQWNQNGTKTKEMKLAKEGSRQAASSFYPWTRRNWPLAVRKPCDMACHSSTYADSSLCDPGISMLLSLK